MDDNAGALIPAILLGLGYMLPTLIAYGREIPQRRMIAGINFVLGWTLIGWVVTSIWAATAELPKAQLIGERTRRS